MVHPYDVITAEVISDELGLDWTSEQIESAAEIIENQIENRGMGGPDVPDMEQFAKWEWQPKLDALKYDADTQIRHLKEEIRDISNSRDYWRGRALEAERP